MVEVREGLTPGLHVDGKVPRTGMLVSLVLGKSGHRRQGGIIMGKFLKGLGPEGEAWRA